MSLFPLLYFLVSYFIHRSLYLLNPSPCLVCPLVRLPTGNHWFVLYIFKSVSVSYASFCIWCRGPHPLPSPALRCLWSSENDCSWSVYHRAEKWRMASLQEQMALHAWHNFLRQTRTRTVNTGFACCSHPHQNITMKTRYFYGKGIEILNYIHLGAIGSCYVHIT